MLEGRTVEQKRELAKLVTEAIVKSLQVPPTAVTIIIRDMANYNLASRRRSSSRPRVNQEHDTELTRPAPKSAWSGFLSPRIAQETDAYCVGVSGSR
ncbi:MAG: tautomerase family protein [Bacillota bacterium]